MQFRPPNRHTAFLIPALLLLVLPLSAQQSYVTRFDAYVGYGFLDSPKVNLFENGFAAQFGVRPTTWLSLGVDYTYASGDLKITPDQLLPALQTQLQAGIVAGIMAGKLPPTYPYTTLYVPSHSKTHTFAAGPELVYRHFRKVTLFARPLYLGVIHEAATPQPQDPVVAALVASLIPTPSKTDNVMFLGFGGGFDILFGKHFAFRAQSDLVHDHLFNDLLKDGRWTVRFSCGPAFNFGKNIVK